MKAIAGRSEARLLPVAAFLACLAAPAAQAVTTNLGGAPSGTFGARFDADARETRVTSRISPSLCLSLSLPQEWRMHGPGGKASLKAVPFRANLDMSLRSAHELQDLPQPDLARRDAAFLQRDYESLLGRPAQSVSLTSPAPGATRWSATWVDANLPTASQAMTIETLIVPLSPEWVLELDLAEVESPEIYDALVQRVLSGLRVRAGAECRD
jgi:hypothetical protein